MDIDKSKDTGNESIENKPPRKRGRPATGRKTEEERKISTAVSEYYNLPQYGGRPDSKTVALISEALERIDTPPVDVYDFEDVKKRTVEYIDRCRSLDRRPAIAAYALYLGIDRRTLNAYIHGQSKAIDSRSLSLIKYVYSMVDASMEQQMSDGDMNVVAGIFLMRNNLGYTNVDTVEIVPKTPDNNSMNINDVIAEYDRKEE